MINNKNNLNYIKMAKGKSKKPTKKSKYASNVSKRSKTITKETI